MIFCANLPGFGLHHCITSTISPGQVSLDTSAAVRVLLEWAQLDNAFCLEAREAT